MFSKKFFVTVFFLLATLAQIDPAQISRIDEVASSSSAKLNRERGLNMLGEVKDAIKLYYYDKNYHGINLDERFKVAAERIKHFDTNAQIFRVIAQVVLEFDDSHTTFYPPNRANQTEYGFTMQMIGSDCFVLDVKKGSDAEAKGLKIGDKIIGVGNYAPTRENLWKLKYLLYTLDPQEKIKVYTLNPDRTEREIEIVTTVKTLEERLKEEKNRKKEKEENPYKCQEINREAIACKLLTFSVDKKYIDKMMAEVSPHQKMILDLRGNSGGYVKTEEYLTGYFFDHDVKIATFVTRDKAKERIAKTHKEKTFNGDLAVLIDSNSASASEVFSRVIQLEKRGKIVGDVSAGAVMTSQFMTMANQRGVSDFQTFSFFGMNLTIADLIMSDGKRLEKFGVIPDYPVGPTGKALFEKSDPILAYSAKLLGADISPADAGKFHFLSKKAEDEETSEKDDGDN